MIGFLALGGASVLELYGSMPLMLFGSLIERLETVQWLLQYAMITAYVVIPVAWFTLVTGLALVFKDLRNQINGLRGLLAERHLEQPSGT